MLHFNQFSPLEYRVDHEVDNASNIDSDKDLHCLGLGFSRFHILILQNFFEGQELHNWVRFLERLSIIAHVDGCQSDDNDWHEHSQNHQDHV
jgi:hypothetical protein